jgi:probable rRNA maturation factor
VNLDIVNLQRKVPLRSADFREFVPTLIAQVSEAQGKTFTVAFVSDARMEQLNSLFRGKEATTDVLSFPREPDEFDPEQNDLGDIIISAEQAQRQCNENGLSLDAEIRQLILHGLLHLCGYDHETDEGEMNARELELRQLLSL